MEEDSLSGEASKDMIFGRVTFSSLYLVRPSSQYEYSLRVQVRGGTIDDAVLSFSVSVEEAIGLAFELEKEEGDAVEKEATLTLVAAVDVFLPSYSLVAVDAGGTPVRSRGDERDRVVLFSFELSESDGDVSFSSPSNWTMSNGTAEVNGVVLHRPQSLRSYFFRVLTDGLDAAGLHVNVLLGEPYALKLTPSTILLNSDWIVPLPPVKTEVVDAGGVPLGEEDTRSRLLMVGALRKGRIDTDRLPGREREENREGRERKQTKRKKEERKRGRKK